MSGRLNTQTPTVAACATSSITLSGAQTVDGVALTAGMLCLVSGNGAANDVYLVQAGAWIRLPGAQVVTVSGGTANSGTWTGASGGSFAVPGVTPPWSTASAAASADSRDEEMTSISNFTLLGTASQTNIDRAADFTWDGASLAAGTWRYQVRNSRCWLQAARANNASGMYTLRKTVALGTNDHVFMRCGMDWDSVADGTVMGLELAYDNSNLVAVSLNGSAGNWLCRGYQVISNVYTAAGELTIAGSTGVVTCPVTMLGIRKVSGAWTFWVGDDAGNVRILGSLSPTLTTPTRLSVFIGNKTTCLPCWVDYIRFASGSTFPVLP